MNLLRSHNALNLMHFSTILSAPVEVYMSTFDAGIGQIRGELNSYILRSWDWRVRAEMGKDPVTDISWLRADLYSKVPVAHRLV